MNKWKAVAIIAVLLIVLELLAVLISWLLSATMTEGIHSMLSSEGIRWFLGSFVNFIQSPLLVWIILLAIAYGTIKDCNIINDISNKAVHRQRLARNLCLLLFIFMLTALLLLAVLPHAVLLSATGSLWPSPFSHALIPVMALILISVSSTYGMLTHRYTSLSSIIQAMSTGIATAAPLLIIYILARQLYTSLQFIFG